MLRLEIPTFNGNFPFLHRGFEPQDADLKAGPIFFKLDALSAGLLFSDNANLTETDRESGVIAILRMSGTLIVQFSEDIRFAASGSLVYLPTEGEIRLRQCRFPNRLQPRADGCPGIGLAIFLGHRALRPAHLDCG